jgi:hypothetical protein
MKKQNKVQPGTGSDIKIESFSHDETDENHQTDPDAGELGTQAAIISGNDKTGTNYV